MKKKKKKKRLKVGKKRFFFLYGNNSRTGETSFIDLVYKKNPFELREKERGGLLERKNRRIGRKNWRIGGKKTES